jgi:predicted branched-subunit amino acid permease
MWVVSRTAGLLLGPEAGRAEAVGTADVVATALEVAIVAGCVALRLRPLRVAIRGSMLAVLLVASLALTTTALLSIDAARAHGDDSHPPGHEHHDR